MDETIRVYANPYAHIDHKGRPAGAVACDAVEHTPYSHDGEARRFVGAEIDREQSKLLKKAPEGTQQSNDWDIVWKFSKEPQTLPFTHYYFDRIRDGELIVADEDTAELLSRDFVDPQEALAAARDAALDRWLAERPQRLKKPLPEWAQGGRLKGWAQERLDKFKAESAAKAAAKAEVK